MNVPELTLHHQRLDQRGIQLRAQMSRVQAELAGDPESERLEAERASSEAARRDVELRLRAREREVADRSSRLAGRQRELMSGRIRNPTELMKLNDEVEHLKAGVAEQEDAQLELMEEQEGLEAEVARLDAALAAARDRSAAAAPGLRARLEQLEEELRDVETERNDVWERIPSEWQEAYRRASNRVPDPVAEAVRGQCQACRVSMTSSGVQALRRASLVLCENCGRILVTA